MSYANFSRAASALAILIAALVVGPVQVLAQTQTQVQTQVPAQIQAQIHAANPFQSPYISPYASPYQVLPSTPTAQQTPPVVATTPVPAAAGYPVQTYTIWYPRQLQLRYQPQVQILPRWQLSPVEISQPYSYLAPHYRQVTLVGYRPRLVLDAVEVEAWQVEWQRREAERKLQVWQPQLVQQPVQTFQPQWQLLPVPEQ